MVCSFDVNTNNTPQEGSLPPLEPRRMAKLEVCTTGPSSQKMDKLNTKTKQPEHEMEPQDANSKPCQRLLQLSGFLIEVLDQDEELDERSLPYSFQVNTFKLQLQPDVWVKNIKYWNRYGWRDIVQVAAERCDLVKLQMMLQHVDQMEMRSYPRYSSDETYCRSQNSAMMIYGGRSSYSGHSSCATRRNTRRRFYRTAIPGSFAPPS
ncbi:hypothetical protein BBO99_00000990 [Phytophthora kernoviae]|uniref:Uncharacterized protein n=2 Tax=Phytophthora kernoviae TaxID=325452 RepID=A0A3R7KYD8_9STRA|nr:hypothetical protein G195_003048 [Phytophthora kernoviae 00238/432]KAG2529895.1 hypothetical protein JM16_001748 [Phytophthora kernoviae]KAG2531774.1 hypothetical protein JM18_000984 [Phytophthora kernoviae]RLN46513.1 hypothetical protein BBI17_000891 [Phytophthora kernoviae]RLN84835.1 hypothetical protein BBO99_00000990 [Phytophthora kernoviae]